MVNGSANESREDSVPEQRSRDHHGIRMPGRWQHAANPDEHGMAAKIGARATPVRANASGPALVNVTAVSSAAMPATDPITSWLGGARWPTATIIRRPARIAAKEQCRQVRRFAICVTLSEGQGCGPAPD